jgi:hypothetical protein
MLNEWNKKSRNKIRKRKRDNLQIEVLRCKSINRSNMREKKKADNEIGIKREGKIEKSF